MLSAARTDDARSREVIVGAVSKGSLSYFLPAILNELLATRFKIVTGYDGQRSINLAMQRGEVEGREALLHWPER